MTFQNVYSEVYEKLENCGRIYKEDFEGGDLQFVICGNKDTAVRNIKFSQ